MGGIDEAALDRLSLVTEMTKHIRVRASGGRASASELGQQSFFEKNGNWLGTQCHREKGSGEVGLALRLVLIPVHGTHALQR